MSRELTNGHPAVKPDVVAEVEDTARRLVRRASEAIGLAGDAPPEPLRHALEGQGRLATLAGLAALAGLVEATATALVLLAPSIAVSLGRDVSSVTGLATIVALLGAVLALPLAWLVRRGWRRADLIVAGGFAAAAGTVFAGPLGEALVPLTAVVAVGGATAAVLHAPLLVDSFAPPVRGRALAVRAVGAQAGRIVAVLLVAIATEWLDLTWRAVLLALGGVGLVAALAASRIRDSAVGGWEVEPVRRLLAQTSADATAETTLGTSEAVQRVLLIPSARLLLAASAAMGMATFPLTRYFLDFLDAAWHVDAGGRLLFLVVAAIASGVALVAFGWLADVLLRRDPARLAVVTAVIVADAAAALALAGRAPYNGLAHPLALLGVAGLAAATPVVTLVLLTVAPAATRVPAAALQALLVGGVGGIGGNLLFAGIDRRVGADGALTALALPGLVAACCLWQARRTIAGDIEAVVGDLVEAEELGALQRQGAHIPLLACRHLDFFYGQMQVLFDVDFAVDEGEMVALLGTNGAGKSTLLRAVSGLGTPRRGTVRLRGEDITHADTARRVSLGITAIEGGKATFGPLSVVDNLRVLGYTHGRNRRAVDDGIDATFAAFPRLGERRNQLASTLSGGEQQMLALGKALIIEPELLLIDELSLGLAPIVVGELLEMVRRINASGTAVVLVEQSVSTALSLVDHAYFMEKGEIRFTGRADDLIGRDDLLRSVFLEGATRGRTGAA